MEAAISAPMPRNVEASWAMTSRPVLSTEVARASRSSGDSERRSMTSIDLPSSAAAAAASRHTFSRAIGSQGDVLPGTRDGRFEQRSRRRSGSQVHLTLLVIATLGLVEDDRVVGLD